MTNDALFRYWLMRVGELTPSRRAELSASLNDYKWPPEFEDRKPDGWDEMSGMDKHCLRNYKALIDAITFTTSHFDRSQAWWRYAIAEKSTHEHYRWYVQAYVYGYRPAKPLLLTA